MATFHPSARVRLQIRLEEFGDTAELKTKLEREPPQQGSLSAGQSPTGSDASEALNQNLESRKQLNKSRSTLSEQERNRETSKLDKDRSLLQRLSDLASAAQRLAEGLVEKVEDERNVIFHILPITALITRNGIRDAGTCELELDFRDVPVDPRILRACFVSVEIGTVEAGDAEAGILRQEKRTDGVLRSIVDRQPGQETQFNTSTQFVGFADEWSVDWSDSGDVISMRCRDLSALLRDQPLPTGARIDLSLPISQGVQQLVDFFITTRGVKVIYGSPTDPNDPLAVVYDLDEPIPADSIPPVKKAKKGKQSKAKKKADVQQSAWDHIVDVCNKLGLVPLWRGFTLFLAEPRAIYSSFAGARRMVWGNNIKALTFARKLSGYQSDTIEIRSPDPSIGRTRWARYPVLDGEPTSGILGDPNSPQPVKSRANKLTANGQPEETIRTYFVNGVTDQATLERIARNSFDEIARQEIEGSLETDDIESFDSQFQSDLLALQPGEPVTIAVIAPSQEIKAVSSLQELESQSSAQRQQYLQDLGMSAETAQRLAAAQEGVRLVNTFRAGHVNIHWSQEDGVSIDFDFHNFIVLRDAAEEEQSYVAPDNLTQAAERV